MKRTVLQHCGLVIAVCICALLFAGCPDVDDENAWLVGTWSNNGANFVIRKNMNFVCDLVSLTPGESIPARVRGTLSKDMKGLQEYDFHLKGMTAGAPGDPDESYNAGNAVLQIQLISFTDLIATLTPNAQKSEFVFSASTNPVAEQFFGQYGPFVKQP